MADIAAVELDLAAQADDARAPRCAVLVCQQLVRQAQCQLDLPAHHGRLGGVEQAIGSRVGVAGEPSRSLERQRRRRPATARARPHGGLGKLRRGLLVEPQRRGRQMPCPLVGRVVRQRVGQRSMGTPALRRGRCLNDGRAYERMTESHPVTIDVHEPGVLGGLQRALIKSDPAHGVDDRLKPHG